MTTTSETHNLFYMRGIHKQFFALGSSEVRLSFLIKMALSKLDRWKVYFCLPWEVKKAKFHIVFFPQNVGHVFLFKRISLFII